MREPVSTTLRQLAELVQGELCGDGDLMIHAARPAFAFHNTDYWAHGVNFGLELRY